LALVCPPLGFTDSHNTLLAASGARRILRIRTLFELYSPECAEAAFSEDEKADPPGAQYP